MTRRDDPSPSVMEQASAWAVRLAGDEATEADFLALEAAGWKGRERTAMAVDRFRAALFERTESILSPTFWGDLRANAPRDLTRLLAPNL